MPITAILMRLFSLLFIITMLTSCSAGNGDGLDENGRTIQQNEAGGSDEEGADEDPDEESSSGGTDENNVFLKIQDDIITPSCATSGCHTGTSAPFGLSLEKGKSYDKIVDQPSSMASGLSLVEPYNPEASFLLLKILGTQSNGEQMPLSKPSLKADEIELIRQWILDGAQKPAGYEEAAEENSLQATLSSIQKNVFDVSCTTGCHSGDNPAGTLNLMNGKSFRQLVGRPLQFDSDNILLVKAGDAANSFLINKLEGIGLENKGQRMPLNRGYLDTATITTIKDWINAGAEDN